VDASGCALCRGATGDADLGREEVWSDDLWRLSTSVGAHEVTPGFSYLEPRRHIPHIEDLDGAEAATLGPTLARCADALKRATGADRVYVYVFGGGIPHLHVHLAPHTEGDALNESILRGELESTRLPSGATAFVSKDFPSLPEQETRRVAAGVRRLLTAGP
jgi:diadenosine tetraphosphate (Ap4A) HIT family hydrolase